MIVAEKKYLKGVYKPKTKPGYKAKAYRKGKSIYLGTFATEKEAHEAYMKFTADNPRTKPIPFTSNLKSKSSYDNLRDAWYGI